jgi:predicted transcriptional regulator of viral defense system
VVTQERDGLEVSHTGRARTFVDCLDRLDLAGGVEELFRSVEAWPTVDPQEVLHYLKALNKVSVYAKVGYVLEYFSKPWGLTPSDLAPLRRHLPRAAVYLESRQKPGRFVSDWNLMVPADLKFLTAVE